MKIRDRIKELRRVRASDLVPNSKNWREHSKAQQDAMRGILAEVGYADALLAYETPEGLKLVDGHLRAEITPEAEVPVLVLDITEEEAEKILLTHDPIAAMATANKDALAALLENVGTKSEALTEMLKGLAAENGVGECGSDLPAPGDGEEIEINTEWAIVIICDGEDQQRTLLEEMSERGLSCRAVL